MREWNLASTVDTVELVVSELVTNAVRASADQAGQPKCNAMSGMRHVRLKLSSDQKHVLIEVWDQDLRLPVARLADPDDESGRGLMLVEALCERWDCGTQEGWDGKVVQAVVRVL